MYDVILIIEDESSLCNFCNLYTLNATLNVDFHKTSKINTHYIVLDVNGVLLRTCPNTTNDAKKYINSLITFIVRMRGFLLTLLYNIIVTLRICSQ